jgi:hypothetical protein
VVAEGPQDMFVFALTEGADIEAANMPTRTLDTTRELPALVRHQFEAFYEAAVAHAHQEAKGAVAILEARQTLRNGVITSGGWTPSPGDLAALGIAARRDTAPLVLTRLHVRYDRSFTSDLVFARSSNSIRYVSSFKVHQPFQGDAICPKAADYKAQVAEQRTKEIDTLQRLTGWSTSEIDRRGR